MADKNGSDVQKHVAEASEAVAKLVLAMARASLLGVSTEVQLGKQAEEAIAAMTLGGTTTVRTEKKPRKGGGAEALPCPVTGILNKHRRFSYLMPEARTAANLKKYRGWAKAKKSRASA